MKCPRLPLMRWMIIAGILLCAGSAEAHEGRWLAREQILLYGLGLRVEPEHQTVPRDIATIVSTYLQAPQGLPAGTQTVPAGAEVRATLRGPSLAQPLDLVAAVNGYFEIPAFARAGLHSLENIRVVHQGRVLFYGTPESVTIDVIERLLVTEVTARPLTASEIREKGIVFDQSNFQAYNFTAAFAVKPGEEIKVDLPVLLPKLAPVQDVAVAGVQIPGVQGPVLQKVSTIIPDTLRIAQTQIPNLTVRGFLLKPEQIEAQGFSIPPIPGVIVIPGDIVFLNQYSIVLLMVGNAAPEGSGLVVKDLSAEIVLPPGNDTVVGSADDPLRMAVTEKGESPRIQPVAKTGPDGKLGTADDEDFLAPGESGNAEFLLEGRREGSHVVEMEITGTLMGLPVGPVQVRGRAAGSVLVRNPAFTLTFTHPEIVNDGEEYDLDITVTNTSEALANFVSLNLYPRNISGAELVGEETREIETILPGDSATVSYRLRSRVTGTVYATTLDSVGKVAGRFELKTAVGELGIPLSPDALVLPKQARSLPADLRKAVIGLLGKAYAAATAPAGALPMDVKRFSRKMVWDRAVEVAEAGLRYALHEPLTDTAGHLFLDMMGGNYSRLEEEYPEEEQAAMLDAAQKDFVGFDDLRRRSFRGDVMAEEIAKILGPGLKASGAEAFHRGFAEKVSFRPQHLSIMIQSDGEVLPFRLSLVDDQGRLLGGEDPETHKINKQIPFCDFLAFRDDQGKTYAQMAVVSVPEGSEYKARLERIDEAPAGTFTLSVVLPAETESGLRQVVFQGLSGDGVPEIEALPGDPYAVKVEVVSETGVIQGPPVLPGLAAPVMDPLPTVISAVQQAEADIVTCHGTGGPQLGRVVAVLFTEEVSADSAQDQFERQDITHYAPEENEVVGVALQPGKRIVFLALRDSLGPFIERQITISDVSGLAGQVMDPWTGVMEPTITEEGAVLSGKILNPDGTPVDGAEVRLYFWNGKCGWYGVSEKRSGIHGEYGWDFVLKNKKGRIVAVHPVTDEFRSLEFKPARQGQRLNINVVFLGRATLQGRTFGEDGFTPLSGTDLRVTSMTDFSSYGAKSDAEGRFTIPGIPVGGILIEAVHVGSNSLVTQSDHLSPAGTVLERDLVLLTEPVRKITVKYGTLSGHVLDSDGATPMSEMPIFVYYKTGSQEGVICPPPCGPPEFDCAVAYALTDESGAFSFDEIPAGRLRIYAYDQARYIEGVARIDLPEDGEAQVNVLLSGGIGTVRGIVLDADGNPVAGVAVGGGMSLVSTNAEGIFELKDVPVGKRPIVAVSEAMGSSGMAEVDLLAEGEEIYATIVLKPTGSVTGTVFESDGVTPVPNLKVYLWEPDEEGIRVVATAVTDAQGRYRMDKVPASTGYKLSAFLPDMTKGNVTPAPIQFHGQVVRADVTFIGSGTVRGIVYDDDGATPLKAQVSLSGLYLRRAGPVGLGFQYLQHAMIVENDFSTGEFVFHNVFVGPFTVATGGHFNLMCKTIDVAGSPQDVLDPITFSGILPHDGAEVFATLALQPTSQIRGTVYQPDGATPVGEGVKVTFRGYKIVCYPTVGCFELPHGIQQETVVTDENGEYWLPLVTPWKYELRAEDPDTGRIGQERGLVLPGEIAVVNIRLLGMGEVTVRVFGSDGVTQIPGAEVTVKHAVILEVEAGLNNNKGTLDIERQGTANDQGEITFGGGDVLPEGKFTVLARDPNTGFAGRASGRVTEDGQHVQVNVYLYDATGSVYGTVYRYDRVRPVPNAEILISNPDGTLASAVSDEEGRYRFDLLPLGEFRIEVFEAASGGRGYSSASVDYAGQEVPLNIVLSPMGYVRGTAMASGTLEPLKGWKVTIRQPSPDASGEWTVWRGTTGTDGGFSFPGISVGTFTLDVEKGRDGAYLEGRITRQGEVVGIPVVVDLIQDPKGTIAGMIYNPDGTPAANAEVCLNVCPPHPAGRGTTSDEEGNFVFGGVALGRYELIGRSQVTEDEGRSPAALTFAGETSYVSVVLSGLGTISGHVEWQDGTAAANVQVELGTIGTRFADQNGDFEFADVPAGRYTLEAKDPTKPDLSGSAGLVLAPGEVAQVRLVMQPTFNLSGRVLFSDQSPAQGILLTLDLLRMMPTNPNIPWILYGQTDAEGLFQFRGVPTGACRLVLEDPLGPGAAQRSLDMLNSVDLGDIVLDDTLPGVVSMEPMAGAVNVPLGQIIRIRFSEPVNPGTVNQESVVVTRSDGIVVLGTRNITEGDTLLTFTPLEPLKDEARYTMRISANPPFDTLDADQSGSISRVEAARLYAVLVRFDDYDTNADNRLSRTEYPDGLQDYLGHVMERDFVASFTTVDITPPSVQDASPAPNTGGVSVNSVIRVVYTEPIDPAAFVGPAIRLIRDGNPVEGRMDMILGNTGMVFTSKFPLAEDVTYEVIVLPASDLSGNAQAQGLSYVFSTTDRTPPEIQSLALSDNGTVIEGGLGTVTADVGPAFDVSFIDFYLNGVLALVDRQPPFEMTFEALTRLGVPGQTITVGAVATDTSGNRGSVSEGSFTIVADAPPAVTIVDPAAGLQADTGSRVEVQVQAQDDLGVTTIAFQALGGQHPAFGTIQVDPATSPAEAAFHFFVPMQAVPGSTIRVEATAVDTRGQQGRAVPVEVTVLDATAPSVSFAGLSTGEKVSPGQAVTAVVSAQDLGGIASLSLDVTGATTYSDTRQIAPAKASVAASFTFTVSPAASPGQALLLRATAEDRAGNSTDKTVTLTLADTVAPTVVRLETQSGDLDVAPGEQAVVMVEATDQGMISRIELKTSGAFVFSDAQQVSPPSGSAEKSFTIPIPDTLQDGDIILVEATAVDSVNNVSAPRSLTLTVRTLQEVTLPASKIMLAGDTEDITVEVGAPAPAGGLRIDLEMEDPSLAQVPPSVQIPEGQLSNTFALKAIKGGTTILNASIQGAISASMTLTVRGGVVSGTVYVQSGQDLTPVAGVDINVNGKTTSTDVDGRFMVEGVPWWDRVEIRALDPVSRLRGYAIGRMNEAGGYLRDVIVVLVPAGAVVGTAVHPDGQTPAGEGVRVDLYPSPHGSWHDPIQTVFTNVESRFEFPLVEIGVYDVETSDVSGNRGWAKVTVSETGQEIDVLVAYLGRGSVHVSVKDADGEPVPNAKLDLSSTSIFGTEYLTGTAEQDGTYTFNGIFVGDFAVTAKDPVTQMGDTGEGAVTAHQQAVEITLELGEWASLEGTVYRADGTTPVVGATVSAYKYGPRTETDEQGHYRFELLRLGNYSPEAMELLSRAYGKGEILLDTNGETEHLDIVCLGQGTLVVTVEDAQGQPVGGASIRMTENPPTVVDATTDENGVGVIERVNEGAFALRAESGGLAGAHEGTIGVGETLEVTVTLEETGTITGVVYLPDGATPVETAQVKAMAMNVGIFYVITGPDGRFTFENLPRFQRYVGGIAEYTLEAYEGGSVQATGAYVGGQLRAKVEGLVIESQGQVVEQDLVLIGLGTVEGQVWMPGGQATAPDMPVTLRSLSPVFGKTYSTRTDGAGFYRVERVPVGSFIVSSGNLAQQLWGEREGTINDHEELVDDADIILASNVVTLPKDLYDGNLSKFDIQQDGTIKTGQSNLFYQYYAYGLKGGLAMELVSGATTYAFSGDQVELPPTEENLGREIAVRQDDLGGLNVTRKIYVPQEGYFARYLEVLTNPTGEDITVDLWVSSNFYYINGYVQVVNTSDEDVTLEVDGSATSDRWAVVDDNNENDPFVSSNLPPAAFVWSGPGDVVGPDGATFATRIGSSSPASLSLSWTQVIVPAGESVAFMHFVVQQVSRLGAQASAERLIQLPPEALYGLSIEEMAMVQNFEIPEDGTSALPPLPRLTGQVSGYAYASDEVTPATTAYGSKVYFKSENPFFGRTYEVGVSSTNPGHYSFVSDLDVQLYHSISEYRGIPLDEFSIWAQVNRSGIVTSPAVSNAFAPGMDSVEANLVFTNTGIFRGTVRKATGESVPGAKVTARMQPYYAETTTAGDGTYALAFLPPGQYAVEGAYSTYPQITSSVSGNIVEGETTVLDITFPPVGNVSGVVTSSSGGLLSGATVRLEAGYPNASTFYRQTTTDTSGRYTFTEIPEGYYSLKIYVGNMTTGAVIQPLVVVADETVDRNVHMPEFISLPRDLYDAEGFLWNVQNDGRIGSGTDGAYGSGLSLAYTTSTSFTSFSGDTYKNDALEDDGREVLIGYRDYLGLRVSRKVFVPEDDAFVRYLEIFENTGASEAALKVKLNSTLGSFPNTEILETSSGNRVFDTNDHYIVTDDADGAGKPAMVHVFAGRGAPVAVSEVGINTNNIYQSNTFNYSFNVNIPAYGRVILMHFASQNASRADALASADNLYCLLGSTLAGLSQEEMDDIVNFLPVPDSDCDGLNDDEEAIHGTNPGNPDTDGDGLLDGFEVMYGFDPLIGGEEHQDPDEDDLENLEEQHLGTSPLIEDTDGGGLTDGEEVNEYDTDPLDPKDDTFPLPITLFDQNGYRWDIQQNGRIGDGTDNAYDGAMGLTLGTYYPSNFPNFSNALAREDKGREIVIGPYNHGSYLKITRKVFVPTDDAFVRYLDIFENVHEAEHTYYVRILTDLGSNASTSYVQTSSGDAALTKDDDYIITDDADASETPTTIQVFSGANARIEPYQVSTNAPGGDDIEVQFRLVIPPKTRMILMHFASQNPDRATALAGAGDLHLLQGSAMKGVAPEEARDIVNFSPDTDGDGLTDYFEVTYGFNYLVPGEQNEDPDQDDLSNLEEQAAGTDPTKADTDGDGLSDSAEVNVHGTDPLNTDSDDDGLSDGVEVNVHGTDPMAADTDDDGLSDSVEIQHGLDPRDDTDADGDFDGDGLSNAEEISLGTNMNLDDTDGDGLKDGVEVDVHGTDPLGADSDEDGLPDGDEVTVHGTDPLAADTDGDGLGDGHEITVHLTDPKDPDSDDGGRTDGQEVLADGTDPKDGSDDEFFVPIAEGIGDSEQASLAQDSQGNLHVAWADNRSGTWEIYYSMLSPGGVTLINDTRISNGSVQAGWPAVAVDSQDKVHVAWQDDMWAGEWHEPRKIFHTKLDPSLDDQDGSEGLDVTITLVDDQLISTLDPQHVAEKNHPSLARDAQARVHAVWSAWPLKDTGEGASPFLELHHAVIGANGQQEIQDHVAFEGNQTQWGAAHPRIAADSQGHVHAAWLAPDASWATRVQYMMLSDQGNILIGATPMTGEDAPSPAYPSVAVRPDGKVDVVYQAKEDWADPYGAFLMTIDPALTAWDGKGADPALITFFGPVLITTGPQNAAMMPAAALDTAGNIYVCYYGGENQWSSRSVLLKSVNPDGTERIAERAVSDGADASGISSGDGEGMRSAVVVGGQGTYVLWSRTGQAGDKDLTMRVVHRAGGQADTQGGCGYDCPGDLDADGDVDGRDLSILAESLSGLSAEEAGMAVLEGDDSELPAVVSFGVDYGHVDCIIGGP